MYRYQIMGRTPPALNRLDLGNQLLESVGTAPEICVWDITTSKILSWEEVEKITDIDNKYLNEICKLRMQINCIYGDAVESRRNKNYVLPDRLRRKPKEKKNA